MKTVRILLFMVIASTQGCTADKLKVSTISQGRTLTEIQYAQVLNNVAMFCSNPDTTPAFLNMTDGSCQIADLGSVYYLGDWHRAFSSHPDILGSRTVVQQWGMNPVTDDNELQLLQLAFRRAVGIDESLEQHKDLANDVAHKLVEQLPDVDDFRGAVVNQYEDFKNKERHDRLQDPSIKKNLSIWQPATIVPLLYPSSRMPTHSLTQDFQEETISSVDNKIIYDNEFVRYLNTWGVYRDIVSYEGRDYYIHYGDYEYDLKHPELTKSKLFLPPSRPNPHGGYELVLPPPLGESSQDPSAGFDLRLMSWGDGSGVPASGNNLVIVGIDNSGRLHIRIFDGGGNRVTDTDETKVSGTQAVAVSILKQRLLGLLPPHVLTGAEKAQLISEATSIGGQTPYKRVIVLESVADPDPVHMGQNILHFRYFDEKGNVTYDNYETKLPERAAMIAKLWVQLNRLSPPHRSTDSEKEELLETIISITGKTANGRTFYAESESAGIFGSKVAYVTPEAASVRREIRNLENDLLSIPCDRAWFGQGGKHDIPKDACYVGHCGNLYVWVRGDGVKELSNLTIKTLKIATLIQSSNVLTIPGPKFTPASGFPSL
jgi:hypothetical protein